MYFTPELSHDHIPSLIRKFKTLVGWKNLNKRLLYLDQERKKPLLKTLIEKRYKLEITLHEIIKYQEATRRIPWEPTRNQISVYSFIAMVAQVYERLSPFAKNKLQSRLKGDLKTKAGFGPTAFEMIIAANLLQNNFEIEFKDLENTSDGGIYDIFARKNKKELEVECKYITGDKGRKIHQEEIHKLAEKLETEINLHRKNDNRNLYVSIKIKDRLEKNEEYIRTLKENIIKILKDPTKQIDSKEYIIEATIFSDRISPFKKHVEEDKVRQFVAKQFNVQQPHAFVCYSPNHNAIVVNISSEKEDQVLNRIYESILKDCKNQFSKKEPAILCCQLADVTEEQLKALQKAQKDEDIGLQIIANLILQKRPFLLGIGFMTEGEGYKKTYPNLVGVPKLYSNSGSVFFFKNHDHPLAKDRDYDVYNFLKE
ncbi:MAG TPA: hypothetical protein PLF01_06405 [Alphaproteobacteria bacterium]|nr:hypothetical protein [Alphaproteobacteria bacterium]